MPSPITFGGLASGIDTNSIIDKLVQVERQPIMRLQKQREQESSRKALLGDLITKVNALSGKFDALKTQAAVQGRKVDLAADAPFSASVQGAAPTGSYSIQVNQLAKAQRSYSNTFAGADTAGVFTAGFVSFAIGASNATVNITGTDSLNTVAQKINDTGLRLSAAVIYDGANYRIVVNGRDTGAANAIAITDVTGTGLGLDVPANKVVTAQNAQITLDGIPISSATNTIASSLPGVTLTLKATSGAASTLSVSEDADQLKTSLKEIADAYNEVMGILNKQSSTDPKKQLGPETLAGDSTARQLQSMLLGLPTVTAGPAGNTFTSLTQIGINVDRFGTMSIDENRLQQTLSTDGRAVANLVAGSDATNGAMKKITDSFKLYTDFLDGALPNKQKSIDTRIQSLDNDIARMETAASAYEQRIRSQFTQMEQIIASFQSQTTSLSQLSAGQSSQR